MNIDKNKPILITGANGYIASWIVKLLLEEGHTVHAAVRDPNNKERTGHLLDIAAKNTKGTMKLFKADLLTERSYDEAIEGCELVMHTASPVIMTAKDPQKALIAPALMGTKNVLASVQRTQSVKRVVLTSSVAAVYGYAADMKKLGIEKFTEDNWNTTSTVKDGPYSYSKTLAEKAAWEINNAQGEDKRWDLITINPALVVGPTLSNRMESSLLLIKQLGDGTMSRGTVNLTMALVDVYDVALAHIRAGFTPSAQGRHILAEKSYNFIELTQYLAKHFGDKYPFPKRVAPKWIVYLIAPLLGLQRSFIKHSVNYNIQFDNTYSKQDLKIEYRSSLQAALDTFQQMIDIGEIKSKLQ